MKARVTGTESQESQSLHRTPDHSVQSVHMGGAHRFRVGTSVHLLAAVAAMLALLLASVALAYLHAARATGSIDRLMREDLERIQLISEVNENASDASRKLILLLVAPREQRLLAYDEIGAANRNLDSVMTLLPQYVADGVNNANYVHVVERLRHYREFFRASANLVESGSSNRMSIVDTADYELGSFSGAVQNLERAEHSRMSERITALQSRSAQDRIVFAVLALGGLLLSGVLVRWIALNVARPIKQVSEAARQMADGQFAQRIEVVPNNDIGGIAGTLNLLAEGIQRREGELRRLIDIDPLTELFQRNRFITDLAPRTAEAVRGGKPLVVLCFDIERLKFINALLGFDAGDHTIVEVAKRARNWLGSPGHVARLGGGTLVALMDLDRVGDPIDLALAFQRGMECRTTWRDHPIDIAVTVGLALCPAHGESLQELVRRAEQALFEAKRLKRSIVLYTPTIEMLRLSHLSLLSELQNAIECGHLVPFLQPKISLSSGRIVGAEALARWRHPDRGWIHPAEFIPFAESSGRITSITSSMLRQCLALMRGDIADIAVAVNISTFDLRDSEFPARLQRLLVEHAVDPSRLQIEITESGLLDTGSEPIARLVRLRELGVRIAIDDFGTGQSSLRYLQMLPADELKIDRSFVEHVDADPRRRTLLASIIGLGQGLGLSITAEGVERPAELQVLRELGCQQVQGYLVGKPVPARDFALALAEGHAYTSQSAAAIPHVDVKPLPQWVDSGVLP